MTAAALVTGGTGFVGQWLIRSLLQSGVSVTSVAAHGLPQRPLLSAEESRDVRWVEGDLRDSDFIGDLLDECAPDAVYHLAALAFPPEAATSPLEAYDVNLLGFVRLATELLKRRGVLHPTVLVVGSGEQYGDHPPVEIPLREDTELRPRSVYAATKVAQEVVARQYFRTDGLQVVTTRSFNHSGPGHAPQYLLPSLIQRTAELRSRPGAPLALGNLEVVRDYTHVADVVEAYRLLAERGSPGESYNVCSGYGMTVRELAQTVLHRMGVAAEISSDPALVRRGDIPVLVGSPARLRSATGWEPTRTRDQMVDDLIEWVDAAPQ
jgi:GDP-4-dehydro-6-deoxy-D-mannose reductase